MLSCSVPPPPIIGSVPCSTWFCRAPGAISISSSGFRPSTGSSDICRESMLPATCDEVTSRSGASPVTVTVSWTVDGAICMLMVAV